MNETEIETLPIKQQDRVLLLEQEIVNACAGLTGKQIKFAELMATSTKTKSATAIEAGYSKQSSRSRACRLMQDVSIRLLIEKYQNLQIFTHGRGVPWMRGQLEELLELAKEKKDISGGNGVIRTIAELDGAIMNKGKGGGATVSITITTGLGSGVKEIKGEVVNQ